MKEGGGKEEGGGGEDASEEWREVETEDGDKYYYHPATVSFEGSEFRTLYCVKTEKTHATKLLVAFAT